MLQNNITTPSIKTDIEWRSSDTPVMYNNAIDTMEDHVQSMLDNQASELIWLLEHPPLYTAGTSAKEDDVLDSQRFPIFQSGRGGQMTYHGPGQRIAYVMLDLKKRAAPEQPDLRSYVKDLEQWVINSLAHFEIQSFIRDGRVGVWTYDRDGKECKIAAIGIRIRKWISYHGISINVCPDLSHYTGIVPCGIEEYGVTSLADLGINASMGEVDTILKSEFEKRFT